MMISHRYHRLLLWTIAGSLSTATTVLEERPARSLAGDDGGMSHSKDSFSTKRTKSKYYDYGNLFVTEAPVAAPILGDAKLTLDMLETRKKSTTRTDQHPLTTKHSTTATNSNNNRKKNKSSKSYSSHSTRPPTPIVESEDSAVLYEPSMTPVGNTADATAISPSTSPAPSVTAVPSLRSSSSSSSKKKTKKTKAPPSAKGNSLADDDTEEADKSRDAKSTKVPKTKTTDSDGSRRKKKSSSSSSSSTTTPTKGGGKRNSSSNSRKKNKKEKEKGSDTTSPSTTMPPSPSPTIVSGNDSEDSTDPTDPPASLETANPATDNRSPVTVEVTPFSLSFDFIQSGIPQTADVEEVVEVTKDYLLEFINPRVSADVIDVNLDVVNSRFILTQPFWIDVESAIVFDGDTTDAPPRAELVVLLIAAFSGENLDMYVEVVQDTLLIENVIATTSTVEFAVDMTATTTNGETPAEQRASSGGKKSKRSTTMGASAGVGVFVALLIGAAARSRSSTSARSMSKNGKGGGTTRQQGGMGGHVTVAGDTYRGDSTIAQTTRYAADAAELQSLASEWALSTRAYSDSGSMGNGDDDDDDDDEEADDGQALHHRPSGRLFVNDDDDTVPYCRRLDEISESGESRHRDVLANPTSHDDALLFRMPGHSHYGDSVAPDDLSVDSNVPMKVVDLIKKFSPPRPSFYR